MSFTPHHSVYRIGADVGGTFTDVILMDESGRLWNHKIPSTSPNFEQAVLLAIKELLQQNPAATPASIVGVAHGTTVATNAILERRGARTALVTTQGFRDVFELRRLRLPQLYNLFFEKPRTLIERQLRLEIPERVAADGTVIKPLLEKDLWSLKAKLEELQVEAVAVCLLHSYAYPAHEEVIGAFLRTHMPELEFSLSCEILRERREYERTATTAVNCYVLPVVKRYLNALQDGLRDLDIQAPLQIMQSSGGLTPDQDASSRPVFILESGPAAGVLAARYLAENLGIPNLITFDMGGTTAKASIIENGRIAYNPEYEVGSSLSRSSRLVGGAGELIRVPTIDIAEIGAGGGSIAYVDQAGSLHVGPRSAGAMPGPACYLRGGTEPTLTDANVVLGYIRPGKLANGDVVIDQHAAVKAILDKIAKPLNLSLFEAAEGIHRIANARTMRALREVSSQRGRDPRAYTLIAFGGMGPIHAAGLGAELLVPQIIIPPIPGLFSAAGLLFSDVEHHDVRSCNLSGAELSAAALDKLRDELGAMMLDRFSREGYASHEIMLNYSLDLRFQGQYSEIRVGMDDDELSDASIEGVLRDFWKEHEALYGRTGDSRNPIEAVSMRLIGRVLPKKGRRTTMQPAERYGERQTERPACFGAKNGLVPTPVIARHELQGMVLGPLLIDEYDSTIVIPPSMQVRLDDQFNVIMEPTNGQS